MIWRGLLWLPSVQEPRWRKAAATAQFTAQEEYKNVLGRSGFQPQGLGHNSNDTAFLFGPLACQAGALPLGLGPHPSTQVLELLPLKREEALSLIPNTTKKKRTKNKTHLGLSQS